MKKEIWPSRPLRSPSNPTREVRIGARPPPRFIHAKLGSEHLGSQKPLAYCLHSG
jgi:hypothetical protein